MKVTKRKHMTNSWANNGWCVTKRADTSEISDVICSTSTWNKTHFRLSNMTVSIIIKLSLDSLLQRCNWTRWFRSTWKSHQELIQRDTKRNRKKNGRKRHESHRVFWKCSCCCAMRERWIARSGFDAWGHSTLQKSGWKGELNRTSLAKHFESEIGSC